MAPGCDQFRLASREAVAPLDGIRPETGIFTASDGIELRYAVFMPRGRSYGTVFKMPGKSGTIPEIQRLANLCVQRKNIDVIVLEPRSQAGSGHELPDRHKIHVTSFGVYRRDKREFSTKIVDPHRGSKPLILAAHSMSNAVVAPELSANDLHADGCIAMTPMIEARRLPHKGAVGRFYRWLSRTMVERGYGDRFVPYGASYNARNFQFETNPYTNDQAIFEDWLDASSKSPHLLTRGPTYAWVHAYYKNVDRMDKIPDNSVAMPTKVFLASDDSIVNNGSARRFYNRVYAPDLCSIEELPNTKHGVDQGGPKVWNAIVEGIGELIDAADRPHAHPRRRNAAMSAAAD